MKYLIAVIKPFKLEAVRAALVDVGITGMTISEVKGFGRQSGHTEIYRGAEYEVNFVPKIRIEIAVSDDLLDATIGALESAAPTGKIGDGKVFVLDLEQACRLRTGERNEDAL